MIPRVTRREAFKMRRWQLSVGFTVAGALALSAAAQIPDTPEIATQESQPTFSLRVERNLVLVRVVARDSTGKPRAGLTKEDFVLFDNGKPQTITHFAVEQASTGGSPENAPSGQSGLQAAGPGAEASPPRLRFLALYFDDVHMSFGEIARVREAADRYLAKGLGPGDRVGVFTSSGHNGLDFTPDRSRIQATLAALLPRPVVQQGLDPCPNISPYQAYMIADQRDAAALEMATLDLLNCQFQNDTRMYNVAREGAEAAAIRQETQMELQSEYALKEAERLIDRLSRAPGQRTLVLVSPGFLTITLRQHVDTIIDRALRANVVINTLDARGLDTSASLPLGDASQRGWVPVERGDLIASKIKWSSDEAVMADDALAEFAGDTGGVFFHNNNSMDEAFERVGSFPSVYYTLAYSPAGLKADGLFHTIKVKLARPASLELEARRGYFTPSKNQDGASRTADVIEDAVFSQDDVSDFPAEVRAQFFRTGEGKVQLAVLTHMDLRLVRFRKGAGRNLDELTVVVAVFDADGNLVAAKKKQLDLRLRDQSLARIVQSGLTMKTSFEVPPGAYVVRQVVRDESNANLSALSWPVEISLGGR